MFGGRGGICMLINKPKSPLYKPLKWKEKTFLILIGSVFPWEISTSISPGGKSHDKDLDDVREGLGTEISEEASQEGCYNTSKNAHKWSKSLVYNGTPFPVHGCGVCLDLRAPTLHLIDW